MRTPFVVVFVCTIILTSCNHITINDVNNIQKGMSRTQVQTIVSTKAVKEFTIALSSRPDSRYFIQVFSFFVEEYQSDYFIVYENEKLLYWGYPYEFNRHPDPLLNDIGKTAVAEYEKIK